MEIKLVAVDVDGTITESSRDLKLSHEGIEAVRSLTSAFTVVLVSGSSLPVVASLTYYLGTNGPIVAENGCIVLYKDLTEEHICRRRPPEEALEAIEKLGFKRAWHNKYRHYDISFKPPRNFSRELLERARKVAEEHDLALIWSGFALHVQEKGGGKDRGVEAVLRKLGLEWGNVAAVGDGENDIPLLSRAALSAATADSSEEVKRAAKLVLSKPGGRGLWEFAQMLLLPL
ncbi:MAG: phosphoglycolate phosphatase [Acidilobaceae archaeon]|nr:phosphoglycolate phosphatase [Acidilobaceae archaeon]MCX8165232.1 phosphoglycolate phosphatase [Acidilobaceae archaeon]MDW7973658.1 phosphoglycolate phosphatase [Sulfolobales archaeon]